MFLVVHVIASLDLSDREHERIFWLTIFGLVFTFISLSLLSCCLISCLCLHKEKPAQNHDYSDIVMTKNDIELVNS